MFSTSLILLSKKIQQSCVCRRSLFRTLSLAYAYAKLQSKKALLSRVESCYDSNALDIDSLLHDTEVVWEPPTSVLIRLWKLIENMLYLSVWFNNYSDCNQWKWNWVKLDIQSVLDVDREKHWLSSSNDFIVYCKQRSNTCDKNIRCVFKRIE